MNGYRFKPDQVDPADLKIGAGQIISGRWEPNACQPLTLMGWEFDAVEWRWPR